MTIETQTQTLMVIVGNSDQHNTDRVIDRVIRVTREYEAEAIVPLKKDKEWWRGGNPKKKHYGHR